MYELGYKAKAYYRDSNGVKILARLRAKEHYPTEEEARANASFPETIEVNGVVAYLGEVEVKLYKYQTDVCPDGYCVCPRCYGTGVYDGRSNWTDAYGVKVCFRCEGLGIVKAKPKK